ncbi:MAG: hypothetical protein NTV39_02330 [Candidatus Saccharibacteria bacterium]|nr:hypothetical protein [Candidatus Saccharibacteria bacterium]
MSVFYDLLNRHIDWDDIESEMVCMLVGGEDRSEQEILESVMPGLVNAGFFDSEDNYSFKRIGNAVIIGKASDYIDINVGLDTTVH